MTPRLTGVRAVVLAGGRGRRLAPLTSVVPKPLVPVGDAESILEVLIRQLVAQGLSRITICLGHLGHLIRAVVGDGSQWNAIIDYTEEPQPLGTAGALSLVQDLGDEDVIVVVNGDTLADISFSRVMDHHRTNDAAATVVLHSQTIVVDFGVVGVTPDGMLASYREKPVLEVFVSTGINVINARELGVITHNQRLDMPELLLALDQAGKRIACLVEDGFWLDLGRFGDLEQATQYFSEHREQFLPRGR